ncbi:hypothetical protein [Paraburkholderia fungorum]|uniref:hypothetical protein n=1 Tax=Paraburkholderia fungorum TaxID=134537 RepID=UPI0020937C65|nr:hypothetical protein [Paraburkholderia fungorum]USU20599.1 hypothetical protein NFE55_25975 [Paraburkholderia fungorum]USU27404.1 hypothetical protein NFS19_35585 [Paraburkholderia fungorum]
MSENLRAGAGGEAGRPGPPWMSGQANARTPRSRFNALHRWTFCKVATLAAMIVAMGVAIAVGEDVARTETYSAHRAIEHRQDCSTRYAALLDLAELARRDGKSSEVVVRGLSDRGGVMSECLPAGKRAGAG